MGASSIHPLKSSRGLIQAYHNEAWGSATSKIDQEVCMQQFSTQVVYTELCNPVSVSYQVEKKTCSGGQVAGLAAGMR